MIAVDTNVIVYSLDHDETTKQPLAIALIGDLLAAPEPPVLPWQVIVETMACLRRWPTKRQAIAIDIETVVQELLISFQVALPRTAILAKSLELTQRYSLSHWDSLLVAACIDAGVDTLYSEDMTHGAVYGSLKVLNPFA